MVNRPSFLHVDVSRDRDGWSVRVGGGVQIVGEGTPVVTLAAATKADLKPGAVVFILAEKSSAGAVSTHQIVVGTNGVVPPM